MLFKTPLVNALDLGSSNFLTSSSASFEVRGLATYMMIVLACVMPFGAYAHGAYFTLRSGGRVMITLLFDSVYMWVVVIPIAFLLSRVTDISILWLYPICHGLEIFKALFGAVILRKCNWVKQLVGNR